MAKGKGFTGGINRKMLNMIKRWSDEIYKNKQKNFDLKTRKRSFQENLRDRQANRKAYDRAQLNQQKLDLYNAETDRMKAMEKQQTIRTLGNAVAKNLAPQAVSSGIQGLNNLVNNGAQVVRTNVANTAKDTDESDSSGKGADDFYGER